MEQTLNDLRDVSFETTMSLSNSDGSSGGDSVGENNDRPKLQPHKIHRRYSFKVTEQEDDKANEIKFLDFSRPHGRAFYCGMLVSFAGFLNSYGVSPLLSEIRDNVGLNSSDLWTSSMCNMILNTILRLPLGSMADKHGPRVLILFLLCLGAIPTACTGLFVETGLGLSLARMFSGASGSIFLVTQFWANAMFSKRVVGFASSVMGSNFEYGLMQLLMGTIVFPFLKYQIFNGDANLAWRTSMAVPALISFVTGIVVYFISDDSPKGNYYDRKKNGTMKEAGTMAEVPSIDSFRRAARNINSWILLVMYASIMGSIIAFVSATPLYYKDRFGQTTESAAAIASISGFVAPVGTVIGGYMSDLLARRWRLRGRLLVLLTSCFAMGVLLLIFRTIETMTFSIVILAVMSIVQQIAATSLFAVVPFVDSTCTGSVAGIVSFGIGPGSVVYMFAFRQLSYNRAMGVMGISSICFSLYTFFIKVNGQPSILSSSPTNPDFDDSGMLQDTERTYECEDGYDSDTLSAADPSEFKRQRVSFSLDIEFGHDKTNDEEEIIFYHVDSDSSIAEQDKQELFFDADEELSKDASTNGSFSSEHDVEEGGGDTCGMYKEDSSFIESDDEEDVISC